MDSLTEIDEARRRFLVYLLSTGAFSLVPGCSSMPKAHTAMPMPAMMPKNKSIYQYMGRVTVNKQAATLKTLIHPGDVVETGANSQLVFTVDKDAFLLHANTRMTIPSKMNGGEFEMDFGRALGVFASRRTSVRTPSAVIAIRGTGVFFEIEPSRSYVCTCYGETNISVADNPAINEEIKTTHHNAPRYILDDKTAKQRILPAPFKDHTDQELLLIETLVGRTTPFVVPGGLNHMRGPYI